MSHALNKRPASWPLERVPSLHLRALCAILQSMTQGAIGKRNPLALPAKLPDDFAQSTWQDMGCDDLILKEIHQEFSAMFHQTPSLPHVQSPCGELAENVFTSWNKGEKYISFFTSGSTGSPKACTHKEAHIRQEISSIAPYFPQQRTAMITVPLHHMYGFTFGLLLPLALDIPIRSVPLLPTAVASQMQNADLIIGIPLLWTRFVENNAIQHVTADTKTISILTATSPIQEAIAKELQHAQFRVLEFYGASEMGAVGCRTQVGGHFTLLGHLERADKGTHTDILERTLPEGDLVTYPLLDHIQWFNEHSFVHSRRRDKAVQVGGVNVFPHKIQEMLCTCPGVKDCIVRLMRPEEGYRLKAFIVPTSTHSVAQLRKELKTWARTHLRDVERPNSYTFGEDIPRGPLGKPVDW